MLCYLCVVEVYRQAESWQHCASSSKFQFIICHRLVLHTGRAQAAYSNNTINLSHDVKEFLGIIIRNKAIKAKREIETKAFGVTQMNEAWAWALFRLIYYSSAVRRHCLLRWMDTAASCNVLRSCRCQRTVPSNEWIASTIRLRRSLNEEFRRYISMKASPLREMREPSMRMRKTIPFFQLDRPM